MSNKSSSKKIQFILPPPNVTGSLHIGHALNITLQDIRARYLQAQDYEVTWIPGTDHAGISTQLVSERILKKEENKTKQDLGREKFIEYTFSIKERHEKSIVNQFKKMNTIMDFSKYHFTLDKKVADGVLDVFCHLYNKGLIYKDKRMVHWDSVLQTALSDLEVVNQNIEGKFYHIKYQIKDSDEALVIATTRPETLLGDTAICVNPEDDRYKKFIGKTAIVPIVKREVPVIADEDCEIDKGTGVLKITPAHDIKDFEIGKRHNLEYITVIDKQSNMINVPEQYKNKTAQEARKIIEEELIKEDLLVKTEKINHSVPHGEKSKNQLDYLVTDQWFLNLDPISKRALDVVAKGKIKFFPEHFINTYNSWLENIQPWCISRQLWWGHNIPVWYGPDKKEFVAKTETEAYEKAKQHYGKDDIILEQDPDVLDTWFSSALWPFLTQNYKQEQFQITDFLITGKDIIFFWVARMIMLTLEMEGEIPFKEVYLHGMVTDPEGKKMSKTVGNVINPLDIIDDFGVDPLRLALVNKSMPGLNLKIGHQDIEIARNFITKITNAAKFCNNNISNKSKVKPENISDSIALYGLNELNLTIEKIHEDFKNWQFSSAFRNFHHFTKNIFCDWLIEISKHHKNQEFQETLHYICKAVIKMLEIYAPENAQILSQEIGSTLDVKTWDEMKYDMKKSDEAEISKTEDMIDLIKEIRSLISLSFKNELSIKSEILKDSDLEIITKLAKIKLKQEVSDYNIIYKFKKHELALEIEEGADIESIAAKLENEISEHQKLHDQAEKRLSNENFVKNADPDVINEMRLRLKTSDQIIQDRGGILKILKTNL